MRECLSWPKTRASALGYVAARDDAKERRDRGEKQIRCAKCGRWYFPVDACEHVQNVGYEV